MCQQWPALDEATGHEQHGLTLVALHAPLFTFLFAWMLPCMLKSRLWMGIPKILWPGYIKPYIWAHASWICADISALLSWFVWSLKFCISSLGRRFYMHLCLASLHFVCKSSITSVECFWSGAGLWYCSWGCVEPQVLRAFCKHLAQGPDTRSLLVVQKSHHRELECLVLHCMVEPVQLHLVYPRAQISWLIHPILQHVHVLLRIRFMFLNFWGEKKKSK